jgi:hypothetical protein
VQIKEQVMQTLRNDWGFAGFFAFLSLTLFVAGCSSSPSETVVDPHANDRFIDGVIKSVEYQEESKVIISYEDGGIIQLRLHYHHPPLFPVGHHSRLYYEGNNNLITGIKTVEAQPLQIQLSPLTQENEL